MEIIFLIGRILLGGFFASNALNHFANTKAMASHAAARKVPAPKAAVIASGVLQLVGGLGLLVGIYPIISLLILILFMIPTTFIMHPFWRESDPALRMNEQINFMKNLAITGALLMLTTFPLPWALSFISIAG